MLLLHGWLDNQSAWIPLASYLRVQKYPGAVFTVNLSSKNLLELSPDLAILRHKLEKIFTLYPTTATCQLIGHSRGTWVIQEFLRTNASEFHNVKFNSIAVDGHSVYNDTGSHKSFNANDYQTTHKAILINPQFLEDCHKELKEFAPPSKAFAVSELKILECIHAPTAHYSKLFSSPILESETRFDTHGPSH